MMQVNDNVGLTQADGSVKAVRIMLKYRGDLYRVAELDKNDKPIKRTLVVVYADELTPLL